jgi:spore coat polysaccharide biosynthesis predicted glycosyltransferase SpsG
VSTGLRILIRSAAGPRIGYGHLVRARTLGRALGGDVRVSVRGGRAARECARRLGLAVVGSSVRRAIASTRPALVVIDDPSAVEARAALAAARAADLPVASIHDLGIAAIPSDLAVDGSIAPLGRGRGACLGPRFALIDPQLLSSAPPTGRAGHHPPRVLVALGGGPRVAFAAMVARAVHARVPGARVRVAAGLQHAGTRPSSAQRRAPAENTSWLGPLPTLAREMRSCDVAVVAGGVTLYEACALGVPAVAVPVVTAQTPTVEGFAALHAVLAAPLPSRARAVSARAVAEHVATLLARPELARRQARVARSIVDGRGAERVARALEWLAAAPRQAEERPCVR